VFQSSFAFVLFNQSWIKIKQKTAKANTAKGRRTDAGPCSSLPPEEERHVTRNWSQQPTLDGCKKFGSATQKSKNVEQI
jgi:hypothetical protein